jgi:hypothetical protein
MTADILAKLAAPFPPDVISWRVGSTTKDKAKGMALAYIDARDVQDRFNQVCGLDWQVRHPWSSGSKLACEIGVKIGGEWIWRGDGAGDSDVEAEKGAFSDSFKRAAVRWGVGRYLYDIDSPWVALEAAGHSYKIAAGEYVRLRKLLGAKAEPAKATAPAHSDDALKASAEALAKRLKDADTLFKLDTAMEDGRDLLKKLPQKTYDYLGSLYDKRRTAMELPA